MSCITYDSTNNRVIATSVPGNINTSGFFEPNKVEYSPSYPSGYVEVSIEPSQAACYSVFNQQINDFNVQTLAGPLFRLVEQSGKLFVAGIITNYSQINSDPDHLLFEDANGNPTTWNVSTISFEYDSTFRPFITTNGYFTYIGIYNAGKWNIFQWYPFNIDGTIDYNLTTLTNISYNITNSGITLPSSQLNVQYDGYHYLFLSAQGSPSALGYVTAFAMLYDIYTGESYVLNCTNIPNYQNTVAMSYSINPVIFNSNYYVIIYTYNGTSPTVYGYICQWDANGNLTYQVDPVQQYNAASGIPAFVPDALTYHEQVYASYLTDSYMPYDNYQQTTGSGTGQAGNFYSIDTHVQLCTFYANIGSITDGNGNPINWSQVLQNNYVAGYPSAPIELKFVANCNIAELQICAFADQAIVDYIQFSLTPDGPWNSGILNAGSLADDFTFIFYMRFYMNNVNRPGTSPIVLGFIPTLITS